MAFHPQDEDDEETKSVNDSAVDVSQSESTVVCSGCQEQGTSDVFLLCCFIRM